MTNGYTHEVERLRLLNRLITSGEIQEKVFIKFFFKKLK